MFCFFPSFPFLFHDRDTMCHTEFVVTKIWSARSYHDKRPPYQPWFVNHCLDHLTTYQACLWVVSPPNIPKDDESSLRHTWYAAAYNYYPYMHGVSGEAVVQMPFKLPYPQLQFATEIEENFTGSNRCLGNYTFHSRPFNNITNYNNHALMSTSATYLQGGDALPTHTSFWM